MADLPQVSFSRGEVSPIAADRTDESFYQNAISLCTNFFVRAEGAVSNRPGLRYVGPCVSTTQNGSYLIPFIYNNEQSYLTEWGAGAIQFYSQGAFVQNGSQQANITNIVITPGFPNPLHTPATMTVTAVNTFTVGQQVTITGVVFTGQVNPNGVWKVASATASLFSVTMPTGSTTTYVSGGVASIPFNVSNPYALSDLPNLRWAQSADTLEVVVNTTPPQELKRVASQDFTLTAPTILNGPFQDINTDATTYMYVSGTQGSVTIFCSNPIFTPQHVGALITIQEQFLDAIPPWGAQTFLQQGSGNPVGMYIRSDSKIYQCVNSSPSSTGTTTGTFQPVHTSGTQADGTGQNEPNFAGCVGVDWQFVSNGSGVALITGYTDAQHVTAVVQSDAGIWSNFPPTVVGPPITTQGPFTYTGNGSTKTFSNLTTITTGDPNQFFVTVGGVFQDPTTYTVDSNGLTITFFTAPANGAAISVAQIKGQGTGNSLIAGLPVSTYWAFGSFSSIQGYPATTVWFNDRLLYGGTQLQPQTFFGSKTSVYHDFGSSNPQVADDSITATMNARRENPIVDLIPLSDLLIGTASSILRVTHSAAVGAITPTDISVLPQNFYGQEAVPSVQTGDTVIYVQWGGRKIRDLVYQFQYDKFVGTELTVFARHMFPFGTTATRMAFAPEPYGLLYVVRSDGVLCVCSYLPEQQITAWQTWTTDGFFEDVSVLPENGSFTTYVIVRRTVNGQTVRNIESFASRDYASIDDAFFVDSGLTYDGRNTTNVSMVLTGGTTWLAGDTGTLGASTTNGWVNFQPSDVGNAIWIYDANGNRARLKIATYLSPAQVAVTFQDIVPATLQGQPTTTWTFARLQFGGLTNLIGEEIVIFADGGVMPETTVDAAGSFTVPTPCGVVHAGLSYTQQLQGLNLTQQGQPTIRNKVKIPRRISFVVDESLPFQCGNSFDNLVEIEQRQFEDYGLAVSPHTGVVHSLISSVAEDDAQICVQNTNPTPLTLLSWIVDAEVGEAP